MGTHTPQFHSLPPHAVVFNIFYTTLASHLWFQRMRTYFSSSLGWCVESGAESCIRALGHLSTTGYSYSL